MRNLFVLLLIAGLAAFAWAVRDEVLLYAVENGWQGVAEQVLRAGANANVEDDRGVSALELAAGNENQAMVELLRRYGAVVDDRAQGTPIITGGGQAPPPDSPLGKRLEQMEEETVWGGPMRGPGEDDEEAAPSPETRELLELQRRQRRQEAAEQAPPPPPPP